MQKLIRNFMLVPREQVVWRLFVGSQPSPEQNKLYCQFRAMLVQNNRLKASA
jgi:hypothetical protein